MSAPHWPWNILGTAPTEDRKTIREAYSRLLKAMDPDSDTQAFMDLRYARDAALSGEFLHADGDGEAHEFGDTETIDSINLPPSNEPLPDVEPIARPQFTVEYSEADDTRFNRMVELFLGEGEMSDAEQAELNEHLDALFADPRMDDLGHYARVEAWLAELLADRHPRAARLFPRIADHFHWHTRAHELGIHPAIAWLVGAHEGFQIVDQISNPGHDFHAEWMELKAGKPKGPLILRRVSHKKMANLIDTVRRDYPWLETEHWQPDLVARWEKKVANGGIRGPGAWTWFWMVCVLFAVLPRCSALDSTNSGPSLASVAQVDTQTTERTIENFLDRNFAKAMAEGRTADSLRKAGPNVYATLQDRARYLPGDDAMADNIMMKAITDNYYSMIDKLPYDRQVTDAKFRAAAMRKLKDDAQGCVEFASQPARYLRSGNAPIVLTDDYRNHMFAVVHDDYAGVKWTNVSKEMRLPGDVVGKLIKRSGLSDAKLRATFSAERPPEADYCRAMGSLYELLTEIPRDQASKILPAVL